MGIPTVNLSPALQRMLDEFEDGHDEPRIRLRQALLRMHTVAVEGGWLEEVPDLATAQIDHIWGVEQAGAEVVTLPTCQRVLIHFRSADGCLPGTDMLRMLLLDEAGKLVDQFRQSVSTRVTRDFIRDRPPLFMPVIEQQAKGNPQMVIRFGIPCDRGLFRPRAAGSVPPESGWERGTFDQAHGVYRALIAPDGFVTVPPSQH